MPTRGEKSGRMLVWLRRPDEIEFGKRLHAELGGSIVWRKIMPGFERGPTSPLIGDLLTGEGSGARLRLKSGGPIIQYLGSWLRSDADGKIVLESGELAFRWSPADDTPKLGREFDELAKATIRVMKQCTLPGLVQFEGKPYRSGRIGKAALELVRGHDVQLCDTSAPRSQLMLKATPSK